MRTKLWLIAAVLLWIGRAAWCLPGFPSYVSLPGVDIPEAGNLTVVERYVPAKKRWETVPPLTKARRFVAQ